MIYLTIPHQYFINNKVNTQKFSSKSQYYCKTEKVKKRTDKSTDGTRYRTSYVFSHVSGYKEFSQSTITCLEDKGLKKLKLTRLLKKGGRHIFLRNKLPQFLVPNLMNNLEKVQKRLFELVKIMTSAGISYSNWFEYSNYALSKIKKNNKRGYDALMEYKDLIQIEKELEKES